MLLVLLAAGCASPQDQWACSDAACRHEAVVAQWEKSRADAVEQIRQLPDELESISVISTLIDQDPASADVLCELLPHGPSKARCLVVAAVSGLWTESSVSPATADRAGIGPAQTTWSSDQFPDSDFMRVRNASSPCKSEVDPHACAFGWAMANAEAGDAAGAAQMCAAVSTKTNDSNRWRHFCFLMAATTHVARWGRAQFVDSVELCGASGRYRARCAHNIVRQLAVLAPPSDAKSEGAWSEYLLQYGAVRKGWTGMPVLPDVLDRFWAWGLAASVARANGPSGDALDAIPRVAVPHLHAALAWEVVRRWEGEPDYEAMRDKVVSAMETRLDRQTAFQEVLALDKVADFWPVDRKGEAHFSAISYLGESRRTMARDPVTDIGLCVLEAAARRSPPALDLLRHAATLRDERIRWTAVRLLEQLNAE